MIIKIINSLRDKNKNDVNDKKVDRDGRGHLSMFYVLSLTDTHGSFTSILDLLLLWFIFIFSRWDI